MTLLEIKVSGLRKDTLKANYQVLLWTLMDIQEKYFKDTLEVEITTSWRCTRHVNIPKWRISVSTYMQATWTQDPQAAVPNVCRYTSFRENWHSVCSLCIKSWGHSQLAISFWTCEHTSAGYQSQATKGVSSWQQPQGTEHQTWTSASHWGKGRVLSWYLPASPSLGKTAVSHYLCTKLEACPSNHRFSRSANGSLMRLSSLSLLSLEGIATVNLCKLVKKCFLVHSMN